MTLRSVMTMSALIGAMIAAATMLVVSPTTAQAATAQELVGTWRLVSTDEIDAQGKKINRLGTHPLGSYTFDASGHYTQAIVPREKGFIQIIASFGDYRVTDGGKTLVLHIVGSQNPAAVGKDLPRKIKLANDELTVINVHPTGGHAVRVEAIWKRLK